MRRVEDDCVGCRDIGLPCMGSSCPNRLAEHYYCDDCGGEADILYDVDGDEICGDCLPDRFAQKYLICRKCGCETDVLYDVFGDEICADCLEDYFPRV